MDDSLAFDLDERFIDREQDALSVWEVRQVGTG
jgi:hypothetical protein